MTATELKAALHQVGITGISKHTKIELSMMYLREQRRVANKKKAPAEGKENNVENKI
jgi:hypothetical protein